MDYFRIYQQLIDFRKANPATGYTENHHILPRSMGGNNDESNLVKLTGREHWIAHLLLWKIHRNSECAHACHMMAMRCEERGIAEIRNSRMYEAVRIHHAKLTSKRHKAFVGEKNSQFGTRWICNISTRENRKILSDAEIPVGWTSGRNRWKIKPKLTSEQRSRINRLSRAKVTAQKLLVWGEIVKEFQKSNLSKSQFIEMKLQSGVNYKDRTLYSILRGHSSTAER